jgi:hypothetical protein
LRISAALTLCNSGAELIQQMLLMLTHCFVLIHEQQLFMKLFLLQTITLQVQRSLLELKEVSWLTGVMY